MIKPKRLKRGDKIAIVSLSWGGLGNEKLIHKYHIAKARLENEFGLEVIAMPHALKGSKFVADNPSLRAKDLTDLPIFYNVNFGHSMPITVLPYGIKTELDCEKKTITLLENATE